MKRKSKQQREAEEKAALRQRLLDMLRGAHGGYTAELEGEEAETPIMLGIETFSRWLGAIRVTWMLPRDADCNTLGLRDWDMQPTMLTKFESVETATEYLYSRGVQP